jgi:hypothetical protein
MFVNEIKTALDTVKARRDSLWRRRGFENAANRKAYPDEWKRHMELGKEIESLEDQLMASAKAASNGGTAT